DKGLVGLSLFRGLRYGDFEPAGMNAGDAILSRSRLGMDRKNHAAGCRLEFDHAIDFTLHPLSLILHHSARRLAGELHQRLPDAGYLLRSDRQIPVPSLGRRRELRDFLVVHADCSRLRELEVATLWTDGV